MEVAVHSWRRSAFVNADECVYVFLCPFSVRPLAPERDWRRVLVRQAHTGRARAHTHKITHKVWCKDGEPSNVCVCSIVVAHC